MREESVSEAKGKLRPGPEAVEAQARYRAQVRGMHPLQRRYFIQTFGCQQNDHDSELLAAQLVDMGFEAAAEIEQADLILFNTCSIRANADQRFFGHLGRAKKLREGRPHLLVAVCGCMMKIDEHVERVAQSYPFVDLIFGPEDIYRFGELMFKRLSGSRRVYDISNEDVIVEGLSVVHERRYRALVTIMYGCNNYCTYCIVPYTRGRERSRRADDIVAEVAGLAEQGFAEVMLLGQNVNSYGSDFDEGEACRSFTALLERLCRETGIPRLRFMTSHPKDISPELLALMARSPQLEKHLHLPLQSGSDRILAKMNRRYTRAQYLSTVREARRLMPELALTTDIIVGFPGETEEDFLATLSLVEEVGFDSAFTFQYSPRYGTPAALLAEQVDEATMGERFMRLVELQNANSLKANQARVGKRYELLIEGQSDHRPAYMTGRASDFHLVNFRIPDELRSRYGLEAMDDAALGAFLEGKFCRVRIEEAKTFSLGGVMEELSL